MRILMVLAALVLVACPPKKPAEVPGDPVLPVVVGDPAPATPIARDPVTECAGEPTWLAWAPCKSGDAVYAVGKAPGSTPLARSAAMNRARAALAELGLAEEQADGRLLLRGSETLDSFTCAEEVYALARVVGENQEVEVTSCEGVDLLGVKAVEPECPTWTRQGSWRVDDAVCGVGYVSGIKNRALALKTARNRALAEAQKVAGVSLLVTDSEVSVSTAGSVAGLPTDVQVAECDDVLYTRVTLSKP